MPPNRRKLAYNASRYRAGWDLYMTLLNERAKVKRELDRISALSRDYAMRKGEPKKLGTEAVASFKEWKDKVVKEVFAGRLLDTPWWFYSVRDVATFKCRVVRWV